MYLGLTSHVLTLGPERSVVVGPEVQIFDERTIYVRFGGGYDLVQEGRTLLYLGIGKGFAI